MQLIHLFPTNIGIINVNVVSYSYFIQSIPLISYQMGLRSNTVKNTQFRSDLLNRDRLV
jgi:hypothetical protein